jgi:PAS domain S-box-containing protein
LVSKDGRKIAVELHSIPVEDVNEDAICKTAIADITQRRCMEQQVARLTALKERLLGPNALDARLKFVTDAVVDVFGADFARIWILGEGDRCAEGCRHAAATGGPDVCHDRSRCLHLVASSGRYTAVDGSHRRVPMGCYKIGRIASGEQPRLVTNDIARDPRIHDREWAASLDLVSFAGYRLLSPNGAPLGVLALFSKRPITSGEETLLEDLASTAAQVIQTGAAEESLRREKVFAETVIDSIPGVFYVLDGQGRFVRWNQILQKVTGLTAELLQGTDALLTIFAGDRAFIADKMREVFEKGQAEAEARYLTADGVRDFLFTGRRMDVGPASYLVGSGVDITERKQAQQAIQRLNEQLQIANRDLEAFTSSVCHDLRRPLNTINGFSQILSAEYAARLDETAIGYLVEISHGVGQMAALIDDLLKLSRVAQAEVRRTAVDLSALVQTVVERLRKSQPERAVEFVIPKGVSAEGDPQLLRVALENLFENAWKYTSKHLKARIEFGVVDQDGEPVCFVRDDGAGFDMKFAEKLFAAFQRLPSAEEFEGSGVGLATVERVIRAHGGRVWAEAAVERGATFFFTLPSLTANNA